MRTARVLTLTLSLSLAAGVAGCGQNAASPAAPAGTDANVDSDTATDAGAAAAAVASLPLRRGYYVASDTPCEEASMASTVLVRGDGISGSRDVCAFIDIVRQEPDSYRVTQSCSDIMAPEAADTSVVTYTLAGDSAFRSVSEDGWEHSARHCEQSAMPEGFRDNDISEYIE